MSDELVITQASLHEVFDNLGLVIGDSIYVSASLGAFGFTPSAEKLILDTLRERVGPEGNIIMPSFNWDITNGKAFDVNSSSVDMGKLSEYFRIQKNVKRTFYPPFSSVLVEGPLAEDFINLRPLSAYGKNSPFDYLVNLGAKHLLIGVGWNAGVAHFHWLEEKYEVPYRHWKRFYGAIKNDSNVSDEEFFLYVRNAKNSFVPNADQLGLDFEATGLVKTGTKGLCKFRCFNLTDFDKFMSPLFEANPWIMAPPEIQQFNLKQSNPIIGLHHVGIVSANENTIEKLLNDVYSPLFGEAVIEDLSVKCGYYGKRAPFLEIVSPVNETSAVSSFRKQSKYSPLHHIAFEVSNLEEGIEFFSEKGYYPLSNDEHYAPEPGQRVRFLSPMFTGGLLVELVENIECRRVSL